MKDLVIDNSMLSTFKSCPRKYYFNYELNIVLNSDADRFKPEYGSAWHEAMAVYYKTGDRAKALKAFVDYWAQWDGQDPQGIRTLQRGAVGLEKYFNLFPLTEDPFVVESPEHIEIGGMVHIDPHILFCFRIDGVVKSRTADVYLILEHKTSTKTGYVIGKPNAQLEGYVFGARALTGKEVRGSFINFITFNKGKKGAEIESTIKMSREEVRVSKEDLVQWKFDLVWYAEELFLCQVHKRWPRNTNACTTYGRCPYLPLCEAGKKTYELQEGDLLYKKEIWQPYPKARKEV